MLKKICFIVLILHFSFPVAAQHLYYKRMPKDSLALFQDSLNKIKFVYKDSSDRTDYTLYFKYLLRFFPKMEYNSITVIFKPYKQVAKTRPKFSCLFRNAENRDYKIYISTKTNPTLDSVLLKNLNFNSQLGMIASELGCIKDMSTDGFFELLGWHVKHMSRRRVKKLDHDNDLKVLEAGLGYYLLALSEEEDEKLQISRWHDAKAYAYYFKHYKNHFMGSQEIRNFIQDLPIYVTQKYR